MGVPLLTQGMRLVNQSSGRQWQELLYARLKCQYERLLSGSRTQESEKILKIDPCVYYYVHRIEPDFSSDVVLFEHNSDFSFNSSCCLVSPFDTGGFAAEHIVAQGNRFNNKVALVSQYSYRFGAYQREFINWGQNSFASVREYIEGVEPRNGPKAPLACAGGTDECHPRLWTWEMRVKKNCGIDLPPLVPCHLFITPERYNQYMNWLRSNRRMAKQECIEHMTMVQQIVTESDDVALKVKEFLAKGGLW